MKKKPINQFEFGFTGQTFNLHSQETENGERITEEARQLAKDKAESEARQTTLPTTPTPTTRRSVKDAHSGGPHS